MKASDNKFPGIILNEAANDGSDFTNPDADYRRLFLGEDGSLHLKDSAGSVTAVGGGSVAADAIWDAAGDLAVGSGANTAARLAKGADDTLLRMVAGSVAWSAVGSLLAYKVNTASGTQTTTSATQADIDATNAAITFTAPPSGNVLVRVTSTVNISQANNNAFFGIRESTTDVVNNQFIVQGQTATQQEILASWATVVTGISAGSHTYKIAYAVNGGGTFISRGSSVQPMIIEVWGL